MMLPILVNLIVTELAVIEVTPQGLVLREVAGDVQVQDVQEATGTALVFEGDPGRF